MLETRGSTFVPRLAGLLVLVLMQSGCNGSAGGSDGDGRTSVTASVATSPDQRAVLAARDELIRAFSKGDARTYCAGITPQTARAEARFVGKTCEELIGAFANRAPRDAGGRREARVVAVDIAGGRAIVVTRSPGADKRQLTLFVRRGGRWLGEWRAEPAAKLDTDLSSG